MTVASEEGSRGGIPTSFLRKKKRVDWVICRYLRLALVCKVTLPALGSLAGQLLHFLHIEVSCIMTPATTSVAGIL